MDKFWMVFVDGQSGPTVRHLHKTEAIAEAGRIFNKQRRRAYVLEVVGHHDIVASVFTDFTKPPEPGTEPRIFLTAGEKELVSYGGASFLAAVNSVAARLKCGIEEATKACEFYK